MKTRMNIPAIIAISCALTTATPASALPRGGREVRIDQENFAKLEPHEQERVLAIKDRLEELMAVDRSAIDPAERAELRAEWKALKHEMNAYNAAGGTVIYISSAAIIIILLLIILL